MHLAPYPMRGILCAITPWPLHARDAALNQESIDAPHFALRLGFVFSAMDQGRAVKLLRKARGLCTRLYVADFILPERNLALPACVLARLGAAIGWERERTAVFYRNGALEGLLAVAGQRPLRRKIFLAGAASLVMLEGQILGSCLHKEGILAQGVRLKA